MPMAALSHPSRLVGRAGCRATFWAALALCRIPGQEVTTLYWDRFKSVKGSAGALLFTLLAPANADTLWDWNDAGTPRQSRQRFPRDPLGPPQCRAHRRGGE